MTTTRMRGAALLGAAVLLICAVGTLDAATFAHEFDFEHPMSWADDISPWGFECIQNWDIADGGKPGKALRISAAVYEEPTSYEGRTLQFNHKPGTPVTISFDVRGASVPPGSYMLVRYFDGYCGGLPFIKIADEEVAPFPPPIWDSRTADPSDEWRHITFTTPNLEHTVLTLIFIVQQPEAVDGQYVEYFIDNLRVETTLLEELMDPGFDWHGKPGESTFHFWQNTRGAHIDWCDYAEQDTVRAWDGKDIHFTLLQFRRTSYYKGPATKHKVGHDRFATEVGCEGAISMARIFEGSASAASWGVRQTVSYAALGLKPEDKARIQVKMKYTNHEWYNQQMTRVQLGIDPLGGLITQQAIWTKEYYGVFRIDGKWEIGVIEFDKPEGAQAFTVYFRHRDGASKPATDPSKHEPQSKATHFPSKGIADWVTVNVIPADADSDGSGGQ